MFVFYWTTLSKRKIKQRRWQIDDWWNDTETVELKRLEKTYLSATFRTKYIIWFNVASNLGLHGETSAINYLSHEWTVSDFSSAPSGEFQDGTTNWAITASLYCVSF